MVVAVTTSMWIQDNQYSPLYIIVLQNMARAAMDMATETHFLSVLDHPHIIKMRAVGEVDMFDKNYFIVLDRLYDTLDEQIEHWKEELRRSTSCIAMFMRGSKNKKKRLFAERLTVARNIASAVKHLHDLNIIYRDMVSLFQYEVQLHICSLLCSLIS